MRNEILGVTISAINETLPVNGNLRVLVRRAGFEPARTKSPLDPESSASSVPPPPQTKNNYNKLMRIRKEELTLGAGIS